MTMEHYAHLSPVNTTRILTHFLWVCQKGVERGVKAGYGNRSLLLSTTREQVIGSLNV